MNDKLDSSSIKHKFGVPYQGSKNEIANEIVSVLPSVNRLVDLFAGGCSISHAGMLSCKWKEYVVNDIHGMGVRLFVDSIRGKYSDRLYDWVSRDEFYAKRDIDPLIALCWSFANNQSQYIYGKNIEDDKRKLHELFVKWRNECTCEDKTMRGFRKYIKDTKNEHSSEKIVLQEMKGIERIQSLQMLQQVDGFKHLMPLSLDYREVQHNIGDVVYCDIPYKSSSEDGGGYRFLKRSNISFNWDDFYDWCRNVEYPVFVSEYEMPDDFVSIWQKNKNSKFKKQSNGTYGVRTEHLFVHKRFI